jgi:hypothetical protein
VACAKLGINFIGSDIDEMYLKEAVERTREASTQRALPPPGTARMKKANLRESRGAEPAAPLRLLLRR